MHLVPGNNCFPVTRGMQIMLLPNFNSNLWVLNVVFTMGWPWQNIQCWVILIYTSAYNVHYYFSLKYLFRNNRVKLHNVMKCERTKHVPSCYLYCCLIIITIIKNKLVCFSGYSAELGDRRTKFRSPLCNGSSLGDFKLATYSHPNLSHRCLEG